ncbi:MAG: flagellar motor protein [Nitrospiraceae bacterium]|jgi:chemotaxis protein MotA|nr:MAG: flagellar motor protein [Nitrospiraceae bacterium]
MNKASLLGVFVGIMAILVGNALEGGSAGSILQGSAALIVFGGTLGATVLSFSGKDILLAARMFKSVFYENKMLPNEETIISDVVRFASKARKNGILSLDKDISRLEYGFFRRAVRLAIDGIDPHTIQSTLDQENKTFEEERGRAAKVFEAAGGYAPTIGIIGAVLGLIHVMENLSDPSKLGTGIAVAFVATVYGVASANLILLPMAKKMINNIKDEIFLREIIVEGVSGIQAGKSPFYLKEHLNAFASKHKN